MKPSRSPKKSIAKFDKLIADLESLKQSWPECAEFFQEQITELKDKRAEITSKIGKS